MELPDEEKMLTLSILSEEEAAIVIDLLHVATMTSLGREILFPLVRTHLLARISTNGQGRKDVKELINPYQVYPFVNVEPPQAVEEKREEKKQRKSLLRRLLPI